MANTVFIDGTTVILASWLNDVNNAVYNPTTPSTTLLGDVTGSGTSPITTTLKTVNTNVGTYGTGTKVPQFTVNGKGLVTAVAEVSISALIVPAGATVTTYTLFGGL